MKNFWIPIKEKRKLKDQGLNLDIILIAYIMLKVL